MEDNICASIWFGGVFRWWTLFGANSEWVLLPCAAPAYDITNWVPPKTKYRVR